MPNTPQPSAPLVAVVVPCLNEEECLGRTLAELRNVLDALIDKGKAHADSYLYVVDDGSTDDTWSAVERAHAADGRVRGLRLSRNFGHQRALLAGLMKVRERCDVAISIDADLQQDPLAMEDFLDAYGAGAEVVMGVRTDRDSDGWLKRSMAQLFYRLMVALGVDVVPDHADYRLLGKRALAALAEYGESNLFLRHICSQLGFRSATVRYKVSARRHGVSKYTLARMLQLALHGITSSSVVPLRIVALTGFAVFVLSAVMACYVLYQALVLNAAVPGWASTTLPIYFIGGVQILCLGVVGEYVGQTLTEVKRRPRYHHDTELF